MSSTSSVENQHFNREDEEDVVADISKPQLEDNNSHSSTLCRAIIATVCMPVIVVLIVYFGLKLRSLCMFNNYDNHSVPWMSLSWGVLVVLERISRKYSSSSSGAAQRGSEDEDSLEYEEQEQREWILEVERFGRSYARIDLLDVLIKNT